MCERVVVFLTSVQEFFVFNSQKKNSNEFKNPLTPDSFISDAKVSPAKSSNNGYGDKIASGKFRGNSIPKGCWKQRRCVGIKVKH